MTVYEIDLKDVFSADDFQDLMEEILPLPDYYGRNLDALHDVLTEQSAGWDIRFTGDIEAEAALGKHMRSIRRMFRKAAEENAEYLQVSFDSEA